MQVSAFLSMDHLSLCVPLWLCHSYFNFSSSVIHFFSIFLFLAQRPTEAFPLSISLSLSLINLVNNIYQHFDDRIITESVSMCMSSCQQIYADNQLPEWAECPLWMCLYCMCVVLCIIIHNTVTPANLTVFSGSFIKKTVVYRLFAHDSDVGDNEREDRKKVTYISQKRKREKNNLF